MKKDKLDFKAGYVLVEDTKNGEARKIPMNHVLTETLRKAIKQSNGSEYVFSNKEGTSLTDVKRAFWTAVKKA